MSETRYAKYQKGKYQRVAVLKDTHTRIKHHADKEGMEIKEYVDKIVPEV